MPHLCFGRTFDGFEIATAPEDRNSVEGMSAGGYRGDSRQMDLYNGVTDFSGRSHDNGEIGL